MHFFGPSVQPSLRQFPSGNSGEPAGFSLRSGFVSAVQKDWSESTLNEPEHAWRIIVGPALAAVPALGWTGVVLATACRRAAALHSGNPRWALNVKCFARHDAVFVGCEFASRANTSPQTPKPDPVPRPRPAASTTGERGATRLGRDRVQSSKAGPVFMTVRENQGGFPLVTDIDTSSSLWLKHTLTSDSSALP